MKNGFCEDLRKTKYSPITKPTPIPTSRKKIMQAMKMLLLEPLLGEADGAPLSSFFTSMFDYSSNLYGSRYHNA